MVRLHSHGVLASRIVFCIRTKQLFADAFLTLHRTFDDGPRGGTAFNGVFLEKIAQKTHHFSAQLVTSHAPRRSVLLTAADLKDWLWSSWFSAFGCLARKKPSI